MCNIYANGFILSIRHNNESVEVKTDLVSYSLTHSLLEVVLTILVSGVRIIPTYYDYYIYAINVCYC